MDTSVGSYEVKTRLPQLLERVARGEKITITEHGVPVAVLVPPPASATRDVRQVIEDFITYSRRRGRTRGDLTIREMIEEGRRF